MNARVTAVVAVTALLAAGTAWTQEAQPGDDERQLRRGMHSHAQHERMLEHMSRRLDLDDNQRQRIENIFTAAKPEMEVLRERAAANRRAFAELDASDPGHDAALANLAREKGEITSESALLHGRVQAQIDEVLTAEQRQQLEDSRKRFKERDHKGKHRRLDRR